MLNEFNRSVIHERDAHGDVLDTPHKRKNNGWGVAKFMAGLALATSLGLVLSGLLLYTSIETNNMNYARLREMERTTTQLEQQIEMIEAENTSEVAELQEIIEMQSAEIKQARTSSRSQEHDQVARQIANMIKH